MRSKTILACALAVVLTAAGAAWAVAGPKSAAKSACCGCDCCAAGTCYPGCCPCDCFTADCCAKGLPCCDAGAACCATAKTAAKAKAGLLATLVALAATAPGDKHDAHAKAFLDCAKACDDCGRTCDACSAHCASLVADGKKGHLKTLRTCQDCAAVCKAASCVVARGGPFSDLICTTCADACKRCGDACDQMKDDPMMKECADECRTCEKACRDMLKHVGAK